MLSRSLVKRKQTKQTTNEVCCIRVFVCIKRNLLFTMGCGSSTPTSDDVKRPHVTRSPASKTPDEEHLPVGIQLTGGERLRSMGLRGQGVKVAVIDSGIDKDHPGFSGKVVEQTWYRSGTPLDQDDHGTHGKIEMDNKAYPRVSRDKAGSVLLTLPDFFPVAGTIHLMAPDAQLYDYRVFGASGKLG